MTAQDHYNQCKDLAARACICADKEVRSKLWELAKQHLESYYELIAEGKE
jgi:thymidylate synthase ThyX